MSKKKLTKRQELLVLTHLRTQGRIPLTDLSRKTGVPVSTLFDIINTQQKNKIITRHTLLFDFQKLNYSARATIMLAIAREERDTIATYLIKHPNVNTLCRITNGYDFILECVFKNIKELETFIETIENKFHLKSKQVHYVVDDLKREGFLTDLKMLESLEEYE